MAAKVKVKAGKKESNYLDFKISGGEWRVEVLPAGSGLRIIDHETDEAVETIAVPEQWGSQWAWNLLPEGEGVYLCHYRPLEGEGPETPEAEAGDAKNPPTPTPDAEEVKESLRHILRGVPAVEDVTDRLLGEAALLPGLAPLQQKFKKDVDAAKKTRDDAIAAAKKKYQDAEDAAKKRYDTARKKITTKAGRKESVEGAVDKLLGARQVGEQV